MKLLILLSTVLVLATSQAKAESCPELLNFTMTQLRSTKQLDFCQSLQGKVVLAVNTASNCGYTPQFKGLEALYQKYKDQGLIIVGFPSNDFNQEFDNSEKTANVCYLNYGVTFPMMEKSAVKGPAANDFFQKLIKATGQAPKWNFYKYLIDRKGSTVTAFESNVTPEELDSKIHALLIAK